LHAGADHRDVVGPCSADEAREDHPTRQPLPTWDNPVQLAEETAMIDMISGGRLVAGIVRLAAPSKSPTM